jgi:hypothetical protein
MTLATLVGNCLQLLSVFALVDSGFLKHHEFKVLERAAVQRRFQGYIKKLGQDQKTRRGTRSTGAPPVVSACHDAGLPERETIRGGIPRCVAFVAF